MLTVSSTELKTEKSPISVKLAAAVIGALLLMLVVAAFFVFGPKPKPEVKYSPYALMMKAKQNPNSLTPDEQKTLQRITTSASPAPAASGNSIAGGKYVPPRLAAHRPY
ncbi:MAG: hypothetical protein ABIY70_10820 [Capsulimonas sp.]|uniref:hypothetical protein n=1 Tax=Capsulimonas sp. TaxID=2494211 RepID=UPI003265F6B1